MKDYRYEIEYKGVTAGTHIRHHARKFIVTAQNSHAAVRQVRDKVADDPLLSRLFYTSYRVNLLDN